MALVGAAEAAVAAKARTQSCCVFGDYVLDAAAAAATTAQLRSSHIAHETPK